jgi:aspartyl-tRNA synthetase
MHLLATNPGKYVRMHDMVLNGNEIGGSIRIHDNDPTANVQILGLHGRTG